MLRAGVMVTGLAAAVGCGRLGFGAIGAASDSSVGGEAGAGDGAPLDGLPGGLGAVVFAWYPLDDDLTVTKTARDVSGNGRDAGCFMSCPPRQPGRVGGFAARFDGTSQYIEWRSAAPAADLPRFTVTAWVKPERRPSDFEMVVARPLVGGTGNSWALDHSSTGFLEYYSQGGQSVFSLQTLALDTWVHLAIVFDGSTKFVYVDGAIGGAASPGAALSYDTSPLIIGADITAGTVDHFFRGQISDVIIFQRQLTQDEIISLL